MRSSTLTRILALFTGLLLVAVLIFGVLFMKQRLAAPKTAETAAASEDPAEHNWNGPFDLRTVTSRIGSAKEMIRRYGLPSVRSVVLE